MKKCPYCAEEIQEEAVVCKHCHKDLTQHKSFQFSKNTGADQYLKKGFGQQELKHPLLTALVIIAAVIAVSSLLLFSGDGNKKESESATGEQGATAPSTPEEKIKSIVASELKGQNNYKQDRLREANVTPTTETGEPFTVRIVFNAEENLTSDLKKKGIETQMATLYQRLYTSNLPIGRIFIQAHTMLVDSYGNEHDTQIYETYLSKDEAEKINWSAGDATLRVQIIPGVWTVSYVHPVYRD